MARRADQIVREVLGNQLAEIIRLTAENESLREALAQQMSQKDPSAKSDPPKAS